MRQATARQTSGMLPDFLGQWLAARRHELNQRFRLAQRRHPQLNPCSTLTLVGQLLAPLASGVEPESAQLFSSVYELILLHAGRGLLAGQRDAAASGVEVLLSEVFPKLRGLLLREPATLCARLSNAVENMGVQGAPFARTLGDIAASISRPDELLQAGGVLAWRMGRARLRESALSAAATLAPKVFLPAMGLGGWPAQAALPLLKALRADAWRHPRQVFSPGTLDKLSSMDAGGLDRLAQQLSSTELPTSAGRNLAGRLGEFSGFGGDFDEPPRLLAIDGAEQRHRFWVRSASETFRIDADVFGWTCSLDPEVAGASVSIPKERRLGFASRSADVPKDATSRVIQGDVIAFTTADSFRIRVLAPVRAPL